jgi:RimJ/RimL family protein N-acetyltransferase
MSEFVVRRAVLRDAAGLAALAREIGSEPEGWLIRDGGFPGARAERRYLRAIRGSRSAAVFVAEAPEGVVGRLSVAREVHPASRHVAELGLMVARSRRRQGVGRALLAQAVEWARDVGVKKLELHVFPYNEPAIRLYETFGFEREGYRKGHFLRAGDPVDAILMAIEVTPRLKA